MNVTQVVQVRIGEARRLYTYGWVYDHKDGRPLAKGDRVELPPNQVQEEGSSGVVAAYGSSYTGPMKNIVRVIDGPKVPSPEEDLWGGWETGQY